MKQPKPCITTLPITPSMNPGLGLMVTPFLMDVLANRLDLATVLALNVNGAKLFGQDVNSHVHGFLDGCTALQIEPNFTWRDDQGENIFWLNEFFQKLIYQGHIKKDTRQIMKCDCGAVESLVDADNLSPARRLYYEADGIKYCKICKKPVVIKDEIVFLFRFPDIRKSIVVFPIFYQQELLNLAERFANLWFLISRSRASALPLWTGKEQHSLDVDFIWQMTLPLLQFFGYQPKILIGSSKNLMACCFMIAMSQLLHQNPPTIVIPPYYYAENKKPLKGLQYSIEHLIETQCSRSLRIFLSTGLNWTRKESSLDFNQLALIQKMSYRLHGKKDAPTNLNDALLSLDGTNIRNILGKSRKTRQHHEWPELSGIVQEVSK